MFDAIYYTVGKGSSEEFFNHSLLFAMHADDTIANPKKWKSWAREQLLADAQIEWQRFCNPAAYGYGPPAKRK